MREYKFRGKRVDSGEWVFGSYTHCHDGEGHRSIIPFGANYHVHIDPETVGQYTGLIDKNGREVYEGDIVRDRFSHEDIYYYKVIWCNSNACFYFQDLHGDEEKFGGEDIGWSQTIVLGTVFDNPDLLGEVESNGTTKANRRR